MNRFLQNPIFLLVATGLMLGSLMPLGRLAAEAGINPFLWAGLISLVPGVALLLASLLSGWTPVSLGKSLRFGILSGLVAYVIPNAVLFLAIPHVGSGLAGLMFALSPIVTAAISIVFRVRPPSRGLLVAVALGFIGAILIVLGRGSLSAPSAKVWVLVALAIPVSLAIGNVFRTAAWPAGATPTQVGALSNLAAAPLLLVAAGVTGDDILAPLFHHWPLALAQWLCSLLMFICFFRLQLVGGPTYLSQIGYIAAAVGLAMGTLWFGETYPPLVWLGAGLILAGIATNLFEKSRKSSA